MTTSTLAVRTVTGEDLQDVAAVLARAFQNDPMAIHLFKNPVGRIERLARSFQLYLRRLYLPRGMCFTTETRLGAALWMPPGTYPFTGWQQTRLVPGLAGIFGVNRLPSVFRDIATIEHIHPKMPRHWYLGFLGVEPANQRAGVGSRLIEPILGLCDRVGSAVYLETFNENNLPFYARHGFRLFGEGDIVGGPHFWGMWYGAR